MKITQCILLILVALTFSCQQREVKAKKVKQSKDTYGCHDNFEVIKKLKEQQERQNIVAERKQEISDSINIIKTLDYALKLVFNHRNKYHYQIESDSLKIRFGYVLSPNVKHVVINRFISGMAFTDIYLLSGNSFISILKNEMNDMAHVRDTIFDVNGDSKLDFLIHFYPMSGCCERDVYKVYLQKKNAEFTPMLELMNPYFLPKQKLILGHCYGHFAPYYKFKWRGYHLDTIEYIHVPNEKEGKNQFVRRKTEDETEKGEYLNSLPKEYEVLQQ